MISDTGMALTIAYPDTTTNYRLIVQNQFCGDTLKQKIKVKYPVVWGFDQDTSICRGQNIQIGMPDTFGVDYEWAPSLYLNNNSFSRPISIPDSSISYTLLSNQEACRLADSISITVLDVPSLSISSDETFSLMPLVIWDIFGFLIQTSAKRIFQALQPTLLQLPFIASQHGTYIIVM